MIGYFLWWWSGKVCRSDIKNCLHKLTNEQSDKT